MKIRIIMTEDGSQSLLREDLYETYHSLHGAKGESEYVFIRHGLAYVAEKKTDLIRVLEIGFGTGLNAFLTWRFSKQNSVDVHYESLESIPVSSEIYEQLMYSSDEIEQDLFQELHTASWSDSHQISDHFTLKKLETTLELFEPMEPFDLIYFDAFAPSKQPEVWSLENLKKCFDALCSDGILVTYCAQGQFKRNLKEAGFEVETLPGAMGKKEMVRGVKNR